VNNFQLPFNLNDYNKVDEFALEAQQYNKLGNEGDWFGCFRGGLYSFYNRIYGVRKHYLDIHSWRVPPINTYEYEYNLTAIFFHMDSAIECFTFALNALGYGVSPSDFKNITDVKSLRGICPQNILGNNRARPPIPPLLGYNNYFHLLQKHWQNNENLLCTIRDQHDVSKHRKTIFLGGQVRNDPPPEYYELLGIQNDPIKKQFLSHPMAEILLDPDPKESTINRQIPNNFKLEPIAEEFCEFINVSGQKAYEDATTYIKLS
jgi:hypothetical protein